ncbi:MAG TPA: hypothetical protein VHL34_01055 [Rhizomicrobium sp.]|jgi:hypothetical protein|nr:hypothetical protein [Rhizomicrobium sp.]
MTRTLLAAIASILLFASTAAFAAQWKAGDKVQAWNVSWYDATIVEIGSGPYAGYYKVKFDGFSGEQYLKADSVRARPGPESATAAWPRLGKYICLGYSGGPGQFRWYLQIGKDTYQQRTPDLAAGRYTFDKGAQRVTFVDGPYARLNWFGKFSVEREGKTHKIVLRSKALEAQGPRAHEYQNVVCTRSSDSTYKQ